MTEFQSIRFEFSNFVFAGICMAGGGFLFQFRTCSGFIEPWCHLARQGSLCMVNGKFLDYCLIKFSFRFYVVRNSGNVLYLYSAEAFGVCL